MFLFYFAGRNDARGRWALVFHKKRLVFFLFGVFRQAGVGWLVGSVGGKVGG